MHLPIDYDHRKERGTLMPGSATARPPRGATEG